MRTRAALVAVTLITLAACSDGGDSAGTTPAPTSTSTPTTTPAPTTTEAPAPTPADADTLAAAQAALDAGGPGCDVLDTTRCLLPFPSNAYLVDGRVAFRFVSPFLSLLHLSQTTDKGQVDFPGQFPEESYKSEAGIIQRLLPVPRDPYSPSFR